jgi:hypothetical protein
MRPRIPERSDVERGRNPRVLERRRDPSMSALRNRRPVLHGGAPTRAQYGLLGPESNPLPARLGLPPSDLSDVRGSVGRIRPGLPNRPESLPRPLRQRSNGAGHGVNRACGHCRPGPMLGCDSWTQLFVGAGRTSTGDQHAEPECAMSCLRRAVSERDRGLRVGPLGRHDGRSLPSLSPLRRTRCLLYPRVRSGGNVHRTFQPSPPTALEELRPETYRAPHRRGTRGPRRGRPASHAEAPRFVQRRAVAGPLPLPGMHFWCGRRPGVNWA